MVSRNFDSKLVNMKRPEGLGEKGLGKNQAQIMRTFGTFSVKGEAINDQAA